MKVSISGRVGAATVAVATATVLFGSAAGAEPPSGDIVRVGGAVVPNSYVVVFKESVTKDGVAARAGALAARVGGRTGGVYGNAIRGFEANMSAAAAKRLAADPAVAYVQENGILEAADTQSPTGSWGLDRIDQRAPTLDSRYSYPTVAANVRAYIVDTGIRFTHTEFGGRAGSGIDVVDGGSADDPHGQGTHVAGTVGGSTFGVAKGVTLVGVRVIKANGKGAVSDIMAGLDWVIGDHAAGQPAVATLSFNGSRNFLLDVAVRAVIADGVTVAAAAGNSSENACGQSPSGVAEAITVGATDRPDSRAPFSSFGSCLDIFAPGVGITSAGVFSDTAVIIKSGTSMATPHVAGVAALVLARNPSLTPAQVRDHLVARATTGVVTDPGPGSPNRLLFTVSAAYVGAPWGVVGSGDLNADNRADLVWHNSATNEIKVWFMDRDEVVSFASVVGPDGQTAHVGPPFRIVGIGDLNADNRADLVWHNSATNETQAWFMDGNRLVTRATVVGQNGQPAYAGPLFRIVGVGDLDADNRADLVWHNSATNETQAWFMNGNQLMRRAPVVGEVA